MKQTDEDVIQKRNSDEIDLGPMFMRMDKAFSKAAKSTGRAWKIIRLRSYIVVLVVLFGIGAGVLNFLMTKPVYRSSITLSSQIMPLEFCKDIVDNLNILAKEKSSGLLADRLRIDESTAGQIAGFNFVNVYGSADSMLRGKPFKIDVLVYDNNVLEELQPALVSHLENNEYTKVRRDKGILKLQLLREKLNVELQEMDSMKRVIAESIIPRGAGTGIIYGEPIDPVNFYKESVDLYERKLSVENELDFMDNIHVINDFLPKGSPDSPDMIRNISYGGALGLFSGILLVLLIPFRKD